MGANVVKHDTKTIPIAKRDLVDSWSVLVKVVVSLRKMGSYYATSGPDESLPPAQQQEMLEALDAYFSPELFRELATARQLLGKYLSDDEAEEIANQLPTWQPKTADAGTRAN